MLKFGKKKNIEGLVISVEFLKGVFCEQVMRYMNDYIIQYGILLLVGNECAKVKNIEKITLISTFVYCQNVHYILYLANGKDDDFMFYMIINFSNCGFLRMEEHPYMTLKEILVNFRANGIASELLSAEQLKKKYNFDFPVNVKGVFEKTGGVLLASKCLRVIQDQFVEFGGVLHDNEKVLEIMPGDIVIVKTNKGCYKTRKLILAPGPWVQSLLKSLGVDLPRRPNYLSVCYWKTKKEGFDVESGYPAWACKILTASRGHKGNIYSTPSYEYPNMIKVCSKNGCYV